MKSFTINFILDNKAVQVLLAFICLIVLTCFIGKFFPTFAGVILCLLLLGGYYGVLFRCLNFCDINFLDELLSDLPRILLVSALSTGFIVLMISLQQTIYIGDSLETWEPTVYSEKMIFNDPLQALRDLRHSINHADYNHFLPMLMALPMHIFGKSFLYYVLYVWFMFGLPGIFFASAVIKTILENAGFKNFPCSATMAIFMILPIVVMPIFIGYANISILLPGSILLAMLLGLDRGNLQRERLFLIAVLCVFAVFQARTAAYMILGLFTGYTLYVIILGFQTQTLLGDVIFLVKKYLYLGAFGLLITLPLFLTFIKHVLTYDIGTAYSAYTQGLDFATRHSAHIGYIGYIIYELFAVGLLACLFRKKLIPYAVFFATWFFTAELLICRVQLIDRQHNYTMVLPFVFAFAVLIAFTWSKWKKFCAALVLLLMFNFCQSYLLTLYNSLEIHTPPYFTSGYLIPIRKDINDIKNFVADMNNLTSSSGKKIFAVLDSYSYNAHTLAKIYMPESFNAMPNLVGDGDIDLSDGFSTAFFDADYVIISNPLQIHMQTQDQQILFKPHELITKPSPISRHFKRIKEYKFSADGNSVVKFVLYEKISPYEKSDIDFVEKIFDELYPNQPDLFKNRFEKYKRENFKE